MKTRSVTKPKQLEVLADHGGARKKHGSAQDASPIVQPSVLKRRKQVQTKLSVERENGLNQLEAKHNFTLDAYVSNRGGDVRLEKKKKRRPVRFEDRAFNVNKQLAEDTDWSMSELDDMFPEDVLEDIDLTSNHTTRGKHRKSIIFGNGHDNETVDGKETHTNPAVRKLSDSVAVTQRESINPKRKPSAKTGSQPELSAEALEFKKRYGALKIEAWQWAIEHFPSVPNSAEPTLNLLQLSKTSPELIRYVDYISACTDHDWLYVFNELRPKLVFSVLGKMLEVHVFGHEMFGATSEQLQKLQEKDQLEMNADALHRHTDRLKTISTFSLPSPNIATSLSTLQASFLLLLAPLHPNPTPPSLPTTLSPILHAAATLSLHTRLSSPKTLYTFPPHPQIGTPFLPPTMHALNRTTTSHQSRSRLATNVPTVTLAGWPALTAHTASRSHTASVLAKAEVCFAYGALVRPLAVEARNWLGDSLVETLERSRACEARERRERRAVVAAGACVGVGLAVLWVGERARGRG